MKKFRTGYTTGTCAAAAARAALMFMSGEKKVDSVEVLLPRGDHLRVAIKSCKATGDGVICSVIKDGGDDPDVTHGAEVVVKLLQDGEAGEIIIEGGEGVGTVTKPGLGLEVGGPAINPVPRRMIRENLRQVDGGILDEGGLRVTISVPTGKALAPKTDNPRLGILGGISILGTSGIVIPYSTASFAAAIRQNLDVAVAMGDDTVVLTTGGRSEDFARNIICLPDHCFVQMGDFSGYAIQQCGKKNLKKAYVMGFVGKLAKMATGVAQTHVKGSKVDMGFLAGVAEECGAGQDTIQKIRRANTARHVMEIILEDGVTGFFGIICDLVRNHMRKRAGNADVEVIMFDFEGGVLGRAPTAGNGST